MFHAPFLSDLRPENTSDARAGVDPSARSEAVSFADLAASWPGDADGAGELSPTMGAEPAKGMSAGLSDAPQLQLLSATVRRLEQELQSMETRQQGLDRRFTDVCCRLQGIAEGVHSHDAKLGQLDATLGEAMAPGNPSIASRILSLERGMKTVAVGVKRAMHKSMTKDGQQAPMTPLTPTGDDPRTSTCSSLSNLGPGFGSREDETASETRSDIDRVMGNVRAEEDARRVELLVKDQCEEAFRRLQEHLDAGNARPALATAQADAGQVEALVKEQCEEAFRRMQEHVDSRLTQSPTTTQVVHHFQQQIDNIVKRLPNADVLRQLQSSGDAMRQMQLQVEGVVSKISHFPQEVTCRTCNQTAERLNASNERLASLASKVDSLASRPAPAPEPEPGPIGRLGMRLRRAGLPEEPQQQQQQQPAPVASSMVSPDELKEVQEKCTTRIDSVDHRVAALGEKLEHFLKRLEEMEKKPRAEEYESTSGAAEKTPQAEALSQLRDKVQQSENVLTAQAMQLAADQAPDLHAREGSVCSTTNMTDPGFGITTLQEMKVFCEEWAILFQQLESQFASHCTEVRQRFDSMQEVLDQKVLTQLWQVSRQLPEAAARIEHLSTQCRDSYAKVEAQEVRLGLVRSGFEATDQKVFGLQQDFERLAAEQRRRGDGEESRLGSEAIRVRVETNARAIQELRDQLVVTNQAVSLSAKTEGAVTQPNPPGRTQAKSIRSFADFASKVASPTDDSPRKEFSFKDPLPPFSPSGDLLAE